MSNLPPSQMPTMGDQGGGGGGGYQPQPPSQSPNPFNNPSQSPNPFNSPSYPPNQNPNPMRFNPNPPMPMQPYQPPRSDSSNRTVVWVIVSMLIGLFTPVCIMSMICVSSGVALGQFINEFDGIEEETGPGIGIIDLEGPIMSGDSFGASEGYMKEQIEWMEENPDVKAIVIRANSPGGDANASDEIWEMVSEIEKPVIISVQGMCASGCLYIASGGDEIMATRNSLVGSIGVISTFFNAEELFDKIGVEPVVIATGENKDFGSLYRDMTEEEEAYWREQIAAILDNFIYVVANRPGSKLTEREVREIATGQVWAADIALNMQLIDALGYEDDAIEKAADLANIRNYRVIEYPYNFDLFGLFVEAQDLVPQGSVFELPTTDDLLNSMQQPGLQYRYLGPYDNPHRK